jgi:hypothetical protein
MGAGCPAVMLRSDDSLVFKKETTGIFLQKCIKFTQQKAFL